ncbi:DNA packaging protein [Bordetella trematum]|uniref:head-tail connector protein n=1 Tax=Bordetella trematum TaxID=123899 RepID=UPI000C777631|nr:head-tail connector protein [Bordetella trematum]AUL48464.1 DNA packaging protein [Bordetella trematum]
MVTLDDAKMYLRVTHGVEDAAIQGMIAAATDATADYLNLTTDELTAVMPAPVKAAILLQVADLYENRERQASGEGATAYYQNRTYERLLNPYRVVAI